MSKSIKKLLVIGAGIGQVPIIELAKKRGLHVTAVSMKGNYPGLQLIDEHFESDIYDADSIVDFARESKIDAVISDQNDLMMPTVSYVAEKLGIPGNTYSQALAYSNKNVFRDNCKKLNIPAPEHIAIVDDNIPNNFLSVPLPWIVKPEDSQSSIGVTKINTLDEYSLAVNLALSKSKNNRAIVEEFFIGHEVVCQGFIYSGKFHLLGFADRRYFTLPNIMIPSQTIFPSIIPSHLLDKIVDYESKMARYINPSFGIVHAEYLINLQTEEIKVVESALRGGGVYISSHLIPLSTGIDVNNLLLDCALGEKVDVYKILNNKKNRAAAYVCFYLPEGKIVSVNGEDELKSFPYVKKLDLIDIVPGNTTDKILHKGMRKGPILIDANTRSELEMRIKKVQETLNIQVLTTKGIAEKNIWT